MPPQLYGSPALPAPDPFSTILARTVADADPAELLETMAEQVDAFAESDTAMDGNSRFELRALALTCTLLATRLRTDAANRAAARWSR